MDETMAVVNLSSVFSGKVAVSVEYVQFGTNLPRTREPLRVAPANDAWMVFISNVVM